MAQKMVGRASGEDDAFNFVIEGWAVKFPAFDISLFSYLDCVFKHRTAAVLGYCLMLRKIFKPRQA